MRSTFKVLFYVKKGSEKPNGNLPLMCRITVDGEIKQFSCKMDVLVLQGLHNKITELYDMTDDFYIFFDSTMVSVQSEAFYVGESIIGQNNDIL